MKKKALRIITFSSFRREHTNPIFADLYILKCHDIVQYQTLLFMHDFHYGNLVCSMTSLNLPGDAISIILDQQPKAIIAYHMQEPIMENLVSSSTVLNCGITLILN